MDKKRPLWKLLMLAQNPKKDVQFTCEECIALLEYDADRLAAGVDPTEIRPSVNRHLALCSNCNAQLESWLKDLEDSLADDWPEK
jgi:hypothetical protein